MRNIIKKISRCLCFVLPLMFVGGSAEGTSAVNAVDLIEYDVVYTVTVAANVTTLNAIFTVTNNENKSEEPLLVAAIYDDGRMIAMQTAQPTISSGATISETVSIVIPEDKSEEYSIKLFAWEGSGSLRPLGKQKVISEIDPYLQEKLVYVTAAESAEFKIFMCAATAAGGDNTGIHMVKYDATKVVPIDLCGFTYEKELSAKTIPNTNIVIEAVDAEGGSITYRFLNDFGRNTGINNVIKFKALSAITDAEIQYTIR